MDFVRGRPHAENGTEVEARERRRKGMAKRKRGKKRIKNGSLNDVWQGPIQTTWKQKHRVDQSPPR
jgi:hypothetical protein